MSQRIDLIKGSSVLLVTRHGKAKAIAPALRDAFGVNLSLAVGVDTDKVRQVQGACGPVDAALAKIKAGFDTVPYAALALASAGEFVARSEAPGLVSGAEVVVLAERETGSVAIGRRPVEREVDSVRVETLKCASDFATSVGFPLRPVRLLNASGQVFHQIVGLDEFDTCVQGGLDAEGAVTFEGDRRRIGAPGD